MSADTAADVGTGPGGRAVRRKKGWQRTVPAAPNEAVNLERGAIFVAIPKTGTTSVRDQISPPGPYLLPFPHLSIRQIRDSLYTFFLMQACRRNTGFPTEGVLDDAAVRAQARAAYEGAFKFSSVRNPWARAVSLYFRSEGVKLADTMSFEAFCEVHRHASDTCLNPTLHHDQLDWITDEQGTIAVDYVYRIEEFATAIDEIRERSGGRVRLAPLASNVNARSRAGAYRDLYTDRTRDLIARRFERDIDTFGYVF